LKALKGFQRINLKARESKLVKFELTPEDLSIVIDKGELKQISGKINISIGGGQPGVKNKTTGNIVTKLVTIL